MYRRLHKHEAIAAIPTAKALVAALETSKAAVSQWPEGPIPENQTQRIRHRLKPERFRDGVPVSDKAERALSDEQEGTMSAYVEVVSRQDLAIKIHHWAQDILRLNATCGLGKTPEGKYQVVWPGLINQWIYCPEDYGQYLGTLDRGSSELDVEHMLEGEE